MEIKGNLTTEKKVIWHRSKMDFKMWILPQAKECKECSSRSRRRGGNRFSRVFGGSVARWHLDFSPINFRLLTFRTAAAAAKSLQSCPTLCDPIDSSPPGSPVPGILQARTLEWVAISFSSAWKWKVKVKSLSRVWLLATPWTAAYQAPPSMGFSRQEYWSVVPLPSPELQDYENK